MIKFIFITILMGSLSSLSFASDSLKKYEISIQNLTKGQIMHHPLFVFHSEGFSLFNVGYEPSLGIGLLATDGDHSQLRKDFRDNRDYIEKTAEASGVLKPRRIMNFSTYSKSAYLSVASMLATTNDGFVGENKLPLNLRVGETRTFYLKAYDAGAEENNESCVYIPGPPCHSKYKYSDRAEGFVHQHPGLYGTSNIDVRKYGFNSNRAAKIIIRRSR